MKCRTCSLVLLLILASRALVSVAADAKAPGLGRTHKQILDGLEEYFPKIEKHGSKYGMAAWGATRT